MRKMLFATLLFFIPAQAIALETYCWSGKWKGQCCTNHIFGAYTPGPIYVTCDFAESRIVAIKRYNVEIERLQKRTWKAVRQGIVDSISKDAVSKWTVISKKYIDADVSPALKLFLRLLKENNNQFRITAIKGGFHKKTYCVKKTPNGHCAGLAVDMVPLDEGWYKLRSSIRKMIPKGIRYKALLLDKNSCPACTGKHIHFEFLSQQDAQTFLVWKTSRLFQEF
ncbi:MAG: hypothetical protein B7C24_16470 [Bacteroidetes bacterium 4572_77]|nr:MAG: hypothetical protein B7C24_16470 [Bacteroidetes bacterium 4572_77]